MADTAASVADYMAAWNEADAQKRRALLDRCWAEDGVYQDPTAHVSGRDGLDAHIVQFHNNMAGCKIETTSAVDCHHDVCHFTWAMVGPDGAVRVAGRDFGTFDGEGRVKTITGFFGG